MTYKKKTHSSRRAEHEAGGLISPGKKSAPVVRGACPAILLRAVVQGGDTRGVSVVLQAGQRHPRLLQEALGGALRVAVAEVGPRRDACLRLLLRATPPPTAADRELALCDAAQRGDLAAVRLLLGPDTAARGSMPGCRVAACESSTILLP